MKKAEIVSLISRILVGGVFIYAGFLKISAPVEEFAYAIESYKIFSYKISLLSAYFMPWFELYLGVFILTGVYIRFFSIISIMTFLAFEFFLIQAIIRKLPITNCGCFGSSHSNSIYTEFSLNFIWIILSFISLLYGKFLSIDLWLERKVVNEK